MNREAGGFANSAVISGRSRGHSQHVPPMAQNFLNFLQFFGKFWQNCRLMPHPGWLVPPPTGNPGSAPGYSLDSSMHKLQSKDW